MTVIKTIRPQTMKDFAAMFDLWFDIVYALFKIYKKYPSNNSKIETCLN